MPLSLDLLACPRCGARLAQGSSAAREHDVSVLQCDDGHLYVVRNGVVQLGAAVHEPRDASRLRLLLDSTRGAADWRERFSRWTGRGVEALAGKTVLEWGCGPGHFTEWIGKYAGRLVAYDTAGFGPVCRDFAGDLPNVTVVSGDADAPPFAARRFDVVVSVLAMSVTAAPWRSLDAAVRALKVDGELWLVLPAHRRGLRPALDRWRAWGPRLPESLVGAAADLLAPLADRLHGSVLHGAARWLLPLVDGAAPGGSAWYAAALYRETLQGPLVAPPYDEIRRWCRRAGLEVQYQQPDAMVLRARKRPFPGREYYAAPRPATPVNGAAPVRIVR